MEYNSYRTSANMSEMNAKLFLKNTYLKDFDLYLIDL